MAIESVAIRALFEADEILCRMDGANELVFAVYTAMVESQEVRPEDFTDALAAAYFYMQDLIKEMRQQIDNGCSGKAQVPESK